MTQKTIRERFDTVSQNTARARTEGQLRQLDTYLTNFVKNLPAQIERVLQAFESRDEKSTFPNNLREGSGLNMYTTLSFHVSAAAIEQMESYKQLRGFCQNGDNNLNLSVSIEYLAKEDEQGQVARFMVEIQPFEKFEPFMKIDVIGKQNEKTVEQKALPTFRRKK